MCGHFVAIRQKTRIVAERDKADPNILLTLPLLSVHARHAAEAKLLWALREYRASGLPESWEKSIYDQAAEASARAKRA